MKSPLKDIPIYFILIWFLLDESSGDGLIYRTSSCTYSHLIPDMYKKTTDFIETNGFIAETHSVTTEDGYIINLHRIPARQSRFIHNEIRQNYRPVVLIQHGITGRSDNWLLNGNKSFPYLLANAGYDVWLGDSRGNHYSKKHVRMVANQSEYWDFSFHEMGYYDLPAAINYILGTTGQKKLFYIGHSRGTTMIYILLSTRPEYNNKFHLIMSLAPVAYLKHSKSPLLQAVFKSSFDDFQRITANARSASLPGLNPKSTQFRQFFCGNKAATKSVCMQIIFLLNGFDYELFNSTKLAVYVSHFPDGGPLKEIFHFIQVAISDKFQQYDYGLHKNLKMYHSPEPPEYELEKITAPIYFIYGPNDFIVSLQDLNKLRSRLRNVVGGYEVPFKKFNHIDFLWGIKADELVYEPAIQIMSAFL